MYYSLSLPVSNGHHRMRFHSAAGTERSAGGEFTPLNQQQMRAHREGAAVAKQSLFFRFYERA